MKVKLLFLFCFYSLVSSSQIDLSTLNFSSEEEKELFFSEEKNYIQLFLSVQNDAIEVSQNEIKDFYVFLDGLKDKISKKKPKKKIDIIFNAIHDEYFSKYIDNPFFYQIFTEKKYNCVTASALYSFALDYFEIPCKILETPAHVYLLAYPDTERIFLETTSPVNGVLSVNEKQLKLYKTYLASSKLLSKNEVDGLNSDDVFSNYYLTDSIITIGNLIGIQYYNTSILLGEEEKFGEALNQAEKAFKYHDTKYIRSWINYLCFKKLELTSEEDIDIDLMRKTFFYLENEDLIDLYITELFNAKLIDVISQGEVAKFEEIQRLMLENVKDEKVRSEIEYMSAGLMGDYYRNTLDYGKAVQYYNVAFQNDSIANREIIADCLFKYYSTIKDEKSGLDTLMKYEEIFPFTKALSLTQGYGVYCYMIIIFNHFELDEIRDGEQMYRDFKKKYLPEYSCYHDELISHGFIAMWGYYERHGDSVKAKAILKEGLLYTPNSVGIKKKLRYY